VKEVLPMRYCSYCKVHIHGRFDQCPLCQNLIPQSSEKNSPSKFPQIPPTYARHLALRIMLFFSVTALVISFVVHYLFPSPFNWPLWILLGLASMWFSLIIVIKKRHHITKNIMWQVALVSVLALVWDWAVGWSGWSLDYVLPTVYVVAMLVMYVTARIMKLSVRDYITYLLLDGMFGIIPILFLVFDWVHVTYPSLVSAALSFIFLAAILIFQGDSIKAELDRRMHL